MEIMKATVEAAGANFVHAVTFSFIVTTASSTMTA